MTIFCCSKYQSSDYKGVLKLIGKERKRTRLAYLLKHLRVSAERILELSEGDSGSHFNGIFLFVFLAKERSQHSDRLWAKLDWFC